MFAGTWCPGDDKDNARLIVSQIVLNTLDGLKTACPETSPERHQKVESFR